MFRNNFLDFQYCSFGVLCLCALLFTGCSDPIGLEFYESPLFEIQLSEKIYTDYLLCGEELSYRASIKNRSADTIYFVVYPKLYEDRYSTYYLERNYSKKICADSIIGGTIGFTGHYKNTKRLEVPPDSSAFFLLCKGEDQTKMFNLNYECSGKVLHYFSVFFYLGNNTKSHELYISSFFENDIIRISSKQNHTKEKLIHGTEDFHLGYNGLTREAKFD